MDGGRAGNVLSLFGDDGDVSGRRGGGEGTPAAAAAAGSGVLQLTEFISSCRSNNGRKQRSCFFLIGINVSPHSLVAAASVWALVS